MIIVQKVKVVFRDNREKVYDDILMFETEEHDVITLKGVGGTIIIFKELIESIEIVKVREIY